MRQPKTAKREGFVTDATGHEHRAVKPSGSPKPPKPYTSNRDANWTGRRNA